MPTGLAIYNDHNTLMLSHNIQNPTLLAKGTVTTVTRTSNPETTSKATISFAGSSSDFVLCAFRPPNASMFVLSNFYDSDSGNWVWNLNGDEAVGVSIPYWIFGIDTLVQSEDYGLEIYDASGNLMFHNQTKPLRLTDVITSDNGSYTYDSGRTYAAVIGRYCGSLYWEEGARNPVSGDIEEGFYSLNAAAVGVKGITNGIELGGILLQDPDFGTDTPDYSQERYWSTGGFMIVDVTGY